MLRLFTESLGAFLLSRLSGMPENPVMSFSLPGAVSGRNALNIFLSDMAENAELRSNEPEYDRSEFGFFALKPPLRLKCTYIVSAWPATGDTNEASLIQQELLSEAYRVLSSFSKLPAAFIPAPLKADDLPAPVIEFPKNVFQNRPEFWVSAGCAFHTAFSFCATVSLPAVQESYDHLVEEVQIGYQLK
ncbi:MAG: DUF4255 domain-containing protein [Clostridiales bacterium]|nr:DUF4255 domain-containing protein [Clostridiales bacterium]